MPNKRLLSPSAWLSPLPVVMVSCGDIEGDMNIITLAWVGMAASEPPAISIGVRPTRYSWGLIQRYGDFVVNVPDASQVEQVQYCGSVSGRNEDKFKNAGFTPVKGHRVRAPLIAQCPLNIECRVKGRFSIGSHDLFVGEILSAQGDADILTGGELDFTKYDPLAYFRGKYVGIKKMK